MAEIHTHSTISTPRFCLRSYGLIRLEPRLVNGAAFFYSVTNAGPVIVCGAEIRFRSAMHLILYGLVPHPRVRLVTIYRSAQCDDGTVVFKS